MPTDLAASTAGTTVGIELGCAIAKARRSCCFPVFDSEERSVWLPRGMLAPTTHCKLSKA